MGRTVVIAEKPSVGRDIARVLGCQSSGRGCLTGGDWVVTWAVGHLVTLVEPDELDEKYKRWSFDTLPILPAEIPLKVIASSRDQFAVVRNLINAPETDRLICATDAGREGELIFRYIYEKAGCKKPFDRLWISSMTDEAIQEGFRAIRSGSDYDGLYRSAQCRSQADWLVGMNASRAFTLRYDALLSVGRVQTPTLAILVKRRKEIEDFKPEEYATVTADFGDYRGMYFREGLEPDTHIPKIDDAKALAAQIKGQTGTVISAETTRRRDLPPQLYDLTSLQRDANRLLGFTADKTLKLAQSLYETHKALTYPRTDSRYLPPDMIPRVVQTMKVLPESYQALVPGALPDGKLPVSKRTIDETKVTDHHAILPTPKRINLDSLPEDERQLYDMVVRRMLTAFYPACEYDATKVITGVGEHQFRTNGRVVLQNGWRDVPPLANPPKAGGAKKKSADAEEETALPPLEVSQDLKLNKLSAEQKFTQPPPYYTEATLIHALEENGIGRPSTYAPIITTIVDRGYVEKEQKKLKTTPLGRAVNQVMLEQFPDIVDPTFSADMEKKLDVVEAGKADWVKTVDDFYQGFEKSLEAAEKNMEGKKIKVEDIPTDEICEKCGRPMVIKSGRYGKFVACSGFPECRNAHPIVKDTGGLCPLCGGHMLLRKSAKGRVYYGCSNYPTCNFMTWDEPVPETCPHCGKTLFKRRGQLYCAKEGCGFVKNIEKTKAEK